LINKPKNARLLELRSKKLVIYSYSLSNNLLKEALFKMGISFVLTNDIKKASLIIGLKKHLKQNLKLKNLAKQKNIPIYSLNQLSFYQLTKFVEFISL
jgi:PleD family two-component response regulator